MKPLVKKEKSSSVSEESATQRPKRSTCQKSFDNRGILWREETDLKKALYASLQETRKRNLEDEEEEPEDEEEEKANSHTPPVNGENESPKKVKVHAQRKFAQGSTPTSPVPTPQKVPSLNNSTTELIPYRRPKTEDFLTFLCLRGTSILPPSLDFLNCCSKSDTSSECRSLSPDLDVTECASSAIVKGNELKEKVNIKHETVPNGISKKHTACKASSKRHPNGPLQLKKSKSQKEVSVVKKRKSRDENDSEFIPPYNGAHSVALSTNGRTRASTLNALREKYKKQRLAAGKKKNLPVINTTSSDKKSVKTKPISEQREAKKKTQSNISTRNQNKSTSGFVHKLKSAKLDKKLAIEKRKSLRSAHFAKGPGRRKAMNKKTMFLRRAKLVPPIVDVDSESEPEVLNSGQEKKSAQKTSPKSEPEKRIKKSQSPNNDSKSKTTLTSRQILLRKHMQNRLKAKKSVLHKKNLKSKVITKHSVVKQHILSKTRKNIGLKSTMSLRKDQKNKRVTRSAKQQIEEMLWANPEKRTRSQLSGPPTQKSLKKRTMPDTQPIKKQKLEIPVKRRDGRPIRSCDNLIKQNSTNLIKNVPKPQANKHLLDSSKPSSPKGKTASNTLQNVKRTKTISTKEMKHSTSNVLNKKDLVAPTKSSIPKSKTDIKSKTTITKVENSANIHKTGVSSKMENKIKAEKCDPTKPNSSLGTENNSKAGNKTLLNSKLKTDDTKVINKTSKLVNVKAHQANSHASEHSKNISKSTKLVNNLHDQKNISENNNIAFQKSVSTSSIVNCIQPTNKSAKSLSCASKTENSFRPIVNNSQSYPPSNFSPTNRFDRKISQKSIITNVVKNCVFESNERDNSLTEFKELNVQNNLNINKIDKTNDKDISKLMTLNVGYKEAFNLPSCKPSTSTSIANEVNSLTTSFNNSFELSSNKSHLFKKHNDKKYFKKGIQLNNVKLPHKNSDRKQIRSMGKCLESSKELFEGRINKFNVVSSGSSSNAPLNKCNNLVFDYTSDSDSFSSSEELSNLFKKKESPKSETPKKSVSNPCIVTEKPSNERFINEIPLEKRKDVPLYSNTEDNLIVANCSSHNQGIITKEGEKIKNVVAHSFKNDAETDDSDCDLTIEEYLKLTKSVVSPSTKLASLNATPIKKEINHTSSNIVNERSTKHIKKEAEKCLKKEDNCIKEGQKEAQKPKKDGELQKFKKEGDKEMHKLKKENDKEVQKLKKESEKEGQKPKKEGEKESQKPKKESEKESQKSKKESEKDSQKPKKENEKEVQKPKKEGEKEVQKIKKDGVSSKHKKDKESKVRSHDKSSKKDEKVSKKDPEKSLAKLLKKGKDRLKSSKKEEKSKHKRDGSCSSKSSKREFDKDGSKLRRESEKDSSSLEKFCEKRVEFLEIKKDKSSRKESSKVSRSNSFEETKSPKKKKKYNEFKDIEKIKNLISNSSILNEISGFKAFKRRLSGDKSELKKRLSKKKKKLALLKEKKLSKKLSSKLLRKYSKKKGLKSKKNKLKKKGLKKELKMSSLNKVHSKNKKQKHKIKEHHRKDSVEKIKPIDVALANVNKVYTPATPSIPDKPVISLPVSDNKLNVACSVNNAQTSTSDIGVSANFHIENIPEVIPIIETAIVASNVAQTISTDLVFSSCEDLPAIITTEYAGVVEEGFPPATILLATRDSVSQVPLQFTQDAQIQKVMADAATNTCEEDIDEVISSIPEHLRNDEMSVGTQTITPTGSPSPTLENRSLLTPDLVESTSVNPACSRPSTSSSFSKPTSKSTSVNTADNRPSSSVSFPKPKLATISTPASTPAKLKTGSNNLVLPLSTPSTSKDFKNISTQSLVEAIASKKSAITQENLSPRTSEISSTTNSTITPKKVPIKSVDNPLDSTALLHSKKESAIKTESMPSKIKKRTSSIKKHKMESSFTSSKSESFPLDVSKMVSAPTYYPTSEEFRDPLEYISKICPEAEQFGICKIVPPPSFKPECKVSDDLRFMALNQYLHKMLYRWGPNVQHTACIRKHLKSQKVKLEQSPLIGGIELDVSKFFHTVQQLGGLQQVIEKKKWQKVADALRVPKAAQDRVTKLYDAYCKYLVSYDLLPAEEKQKLEDEVIAEHEEYVKLRNSKEFDRDEEIDEEENLECVTKGRSMALSNFFRIARNTMSMWFKNDHPSPEDVEPEFWKIVTERNQHVVVHAGNIDSNTSQSGFPSNKSAFAKHPWNLKVLTNNNRSILRSMGPISGITSPTLHVGMLFTTSCWYRDPHSLPWIEYLHTGASKIWYGIPACGSEKFRTAMTKIAPECCIDKPLWLSSESSMIPPDLLVKNGSSLTRTIQKSGQFVIIFPESFTSTICCGYCVSESVYFAPTMWLDLAEKAFQDILSSCESPAFSLEKLLFSIAKDSKPQLKVLQKILPMIENIRSKEMGLRAQLQELGLTELERLPVSEPPKDKKKKSKSIIYESEPECEICSAPCYLSRVFYISEDTVYCLPHALEHIQKKNLKLCKIVYTYDEGDINEIVKRIKDLVSQLPINAPKKKSPKKKVLPVVEK